MSPWVWQKVTAALFLAVVVFAGCLEGSDPGSFDGSMTNGSQGEHEEEQDLDGKGGSVYERVTGEGSGSQGSGWCSPLFAVSECVDSQLEFFEVACAPPQKMLGNVSLRPDPAEGVGPGGAQGEHGGIGSEQGNTTSDQEPYVHCAYGVEWWATAGSMAPGFTLDVVVVHGDSVQQKSCEVSAGGSCGVGGRLDGAFTLHGPGEEIEMETMLEAVLDRGGVLGNLDWSGNELTRTWTVRT